MAILLRRGFIPDVSTSFLIDTLTSKPLIAYSTRKLSSTAPANPLRAISSGSGNPTHDCIYTAGGDLNQTDFDSWITGAGLNGDAGISIWNDQSGNGVNATSASVAGSPALYVGSDMTLNGHIAPRYCDANGIPGGQGVLSSSFLSFQGSVQAQPFTVSIVFKYVSSTTGNHLMNAGTGSDIRAVGDSPLANYFIGAGILRNGGTPNTTQTHSSIWIYNTLVSSQINIDNSNVLNTALDIGGNSLFGGPGTEQFSAGSTNAFICEFMLFSGSLGSPDQTLIYNSQKSYWGTP